MSAWSGWRQVGGGKWVEARAREGGMGFKREGGVGFKREGGVGFKREGGVGFKVLRLTWPESWGRGQKCDRRNASEIAWLPCTSNHT